MTTASELFTLVIFSENKTRFSTKITHIAVYLRLVEARVGLTILTLELKGQRLLSTNHFEILILFYGYEL